MAPATYWVLEQEAGQVDVIVQRWRQSGGGTSAVLLAETVERLAVLCGELLRERDVFLVPTSAIPVGEACAENSHIFLVEVIASP